ncbi:MAG TPA: transketolase [Clostridiaceae bacterium]|nr:transketolase [Clostridiaceae bacterium]
MTGENLKLAALAFDLRKFIVDMIVEAKAGHIGGDMSVLEILMTIYMKQMKVDVNRPDDPNRDRFVMSKGHSVEAYYAVLAEMGFIDKEELLNTFSKFGSKFIGHPNNEVPGIEMNSGSLGHGLPVAVGMALAGKRDKAPYRVYVVIGDGELAEGSIWEGFMAAHQYKLDNLCAVIDRNKLQISGPTEDVMSQEVLIDRLKSFGWNVINIEDGNSIEELDRGFELAKTVKGKPSVLVANTIKGFGATIMENKADWHHKVPTPEQYESIISEFEDRKAKILSQAETVAVKEEETE